MRLSKILISKTFWLSFLLTVCMCGLSEASWMSTRRRITTAVPPSGWTDTNMPYALYHFETTNGAPLYEDFSGNGFDGIPLGSPSTGPTITNLGNRVESGTESVIIFDGINDSVGLNSMVTNIQNHTNGTMMFWVNTGNITNIGDSVFAASDGGDAGSLVILKTQGSDAGAGWTDGSMAFIIVQNSSLLLQARLNAVLTQNTWHHVAVTMSNSGSKFYIDGNEVTPTYLNGTSSSVRWFNSVSAIDQVRLGSVVVNNTESYGFDGILDDARFYNYAIASNIIYNIATTNTLHPLNSIEIREEL